MIGIVVVMYVLFVLFIWKDCDILVFIFGGFGIVFMIVMIFVLLFLCVMISFINSVFDLIIENVVFG